MTHIDTYTDTPTNVHKHTYKRTQTHLQTYTDMHTYTSTNQLQYLRTYKLFLESMDLALFIERLLYKPNSYSISKKILTLATYSKFYNTRKRGNTQWLSTPHRTFLRLTHNLF